MSTPAGARKKRGSVATAAAAPSPSPRSRWLLDGDGPSPCPRSRWLLGSGGSLPWSWWWLGADGCGGGSGSVAAVTTPSSIDGSSGGGFPSSSSSMDGFPLPPSPSPAWFDAAGTDPSSPGSCHLNRPMSTTDDASSPSEVEILPGQLTMTMTMTIRTEKRILWTNEEDLRLMSAWIEHSTDSTCGADKGGTQYWVEVVESYNKTTPPLRKRNLKQCKDRWHKVNRWTYLFECAYVKARRVFTSGYSDQMWIDAAHKFYVEDNKEAKLGPFVGIEVWKTCREVSKWKTYNEELRNARQRKTFHLEGGSQENGETYDEMPKQPMDQKAAKKASLAAQGKSKGFSSEDDGNSKESAIDLDKLDRYNKF
ncbi:uncharacterized protein C2845_PM15G03170 [Panicum miliaceum]|uniref:Myb-like domain-containing protein n=1 Tax=Panicum miliaceum TaxID=4540 RepID=A0A3L6QAK6_PANMI|nr:uncharacterized protein C2845_PM15G03170 [Panicum miliaceum]